jgi:hypothetical protein
MGLFAQRTLEAEGASRFLAGLDPVLLENVSRRNHPTGLLADHKSLELDSHLPSRVRRWRNSTPSDRRASLGTAIAPATHACHGHGDTRGTHR